MGEEKILHYTLPETRPPVHILEQEGMRISFAQGDPTIEVFPTHIDGVEGNNAVTFRAHKVPHAEGEGAHAPTRGILVLLQEFP